MSVTAQKSIAAVNSDRFLLRGLDHLQGPEQQREITVSTDSSDVLRRFEHRCADPADEQASLRPEATAMGEVLGVRVSR